MSTHTKNIFFVTIFVIIAFVCTFFLLNSSKEQDGNSKTIGINQFMEHPLLDEAKEGMIEELTRQGITQDNGYNIVFRNAAGDASVAMQINQQFVNQKVSLIVALGTPAAQSAVKATSNIPIVYGVITDPVASGLAESEERPGGNKTGSSDRWPYTKQIELIKKICPATRTVGIVLNPGESNTEASMKYIRPLLTQAGLQIVEVPVSNSSEVMQAARSLVGRCDVMLIPGDNTVIVAISSIVRIANENKIPLFAGDEDSVVKGALATYGISYREVGVSTAKIIADILKDNIVNVGEIPLAVVHEADLVLNLKAAEAQGVEIPKELLESAKRIINE
jgi:putative ABC transport system substrate-binding protein